MPVPHDVSATERFSEARAGTRLARALLPYEHVRVTLVRDHPEGVHPLSYDENGSPVVRFAVRGTHSAVILVDKLDKARLASRALRALAGCHGRACGARGARSGQGSGSGVTCGSHHRLPLALDVIECWDRNVPRALEGYVLDLAGPSTEITVVMARRDFPTLRERMLHDRTSRQIVKALGRYPHVDVASVPYYFAPGRSTPDDVATVTSVK